MVESISVFTPSTDGQQKLIKVFCKSLVEWNHFGLDTQNKSNAQF